MCQQGNTFASLRAKEPVRKKKMGVNVCGGSLKLNKWVDFIIYLNWIVIFCHLYTRLQLKSGEAQALSTASSSVIHIVWNMTYSSFHGIHWKAYLLRIVAFQIRKTIWNRNYIQTIVVWIRTELRRLKFEILQTQPTFISKEVVKWKRK